MVDNNVRITQITDNNLDNNSPRISGNNIAWGANKDIFYYGGSTVTQLTNDDFEDGYPSISGYNVAWSGRPNEYEQIFVAKVFYDDPLFRFRNEDNGEYLFASTEECERIRDNYPQFVEEGFAFEAIM